MCACTRTCVLLKTGPAQVQPLSYIASPKNHSSLLSLSSHLLHNWSVTLSTSKTHPNCLSPGLFMSTKTVNLTSARLISYSCLAQFSIIHVTLQRNALECCHNMSNTLETQHHTIAQDLCLLWLPFLPYDSDFVGLGSSPVFTLYLESLSYRIFNPSHSSSLMLHWNIPSSQHSVLTPCITHYENLITSVVFYIFSNLVNFIYFTFCVYRCFCLYVYMYLMCLAGTQGGLRWVSKLWRVTVSCELPCGCSASNPVVHLTTEPSL